MSFSRITESHQKPVTMKMLAIHLQRHRVLYLLLLAGLLTRLYASWALRQNLNLDAGVVTLMVRHITLGTDHPIFFYGQPHMGSLEAWCSAFFCHLLGISGFAVSLGTAFVGFWILPIVYKWASEAAGKRAGYMAVALLIIGPGGFFHYSASPRGAYASALTLGAFVVWFATRMSIRWTQTQRQYARDFLILGFAAGLAWWSNQITTAAILTAGLLLLAVMRMRIFTWRILPGLLGFLIGSAPFWYYNLVNDWASLSFGGTFGRVPFLQALIWLYAERFPSLILPDNIPLPLRAVAAVLYLLLLGYGAFHLCHKRPDTPLTITLIGLGIFVALFSALFAASHFSAISTPRYALPLVAPLAVAIAIAADQFARQFRPASAWVPLLYIMSLQSVSLHWVTAFERKETAQQSHLQKIGQSLEAQGVTQLYASLLHRAWSFALEERVLLSELRNNFYRPHEQQLEMSDSATFLDHHGNPAQFFADAGGDIITTQIPGHTIQQSASPPPLDRHEIPPDQWQSATTSDGIDVLNALTDNTLHTIAAWRAEPGKQSLLITFQKPQLVQGARFTIPDARNQPLQLLIEGRTPDGEWTPLRSAAPLTFFFWSGTRPYWLGPLHRVELRFPKKQVNAIRFSNNRTDDRNPWIMQSLQFFAPAPKQPTEAESLPDLLAWLDQESIGELYTDRWLANAVYRKTGGSVITARDPIIFSRQPLLPIDAMQFTTNTAIAVLREDAPNLKRALQDRLPLEKAVNLGPWTVFRPSRPLPPQPIGLRWNGFSAMRDDAARVTALIHQAHKAMQEDQLHKATQALTKATSLNQTLYHERILLRDLLQQTGDLDAAISMEHEIRERTPPTDTFPPLRFANGAVLTGLTLQRQPPDQIQITYFWQAPPGMQHERLAVFVHFLHNHQISTQDDHVFLRDIPPELLRQQEQTLHLAITRNITIPQDIDPAEINLVLGLYDRTNEKRIRVRTKLPNRRNATTLPVSIPR